LQAGQRVLAVLRNGGGYAEEIVLDAAAVVPIPAAMDFITAAAFPVAYGTSHLALTHRGHLQPGETLLVLGAAGGVGLTAVEIGKAMGVRANRRQRRRCRLRPGRRRRVRPGAAGG
jgi:NADPH2:quinone reductase